MQQKNENVVNKKGRHAELDSASSTRIVLQQQQQRQTWKIPNQVWNDSIFNNANSGFTLIELLVVVLIIGILAAVAVPQYEQAVLKSRVMQVLPYLKAVKNAEETYYLANGEYTSDMESLAVEGTVPSGWTFYLLENRTNTVKAKYQDETDWHIVISFDHRTDVPAWAGITYCYAKKTGPTKYDKLCKSMGSLIPNGSMDSGNRYYIAN